MVKAKNNPTPEGLLARLLPEERDKVVLALGALAESKAERPLLFDLTARETFTDYIIVCHGNSDRHVDAISEGVAKALKARNMLPIGIEGREKSVWVLLDFGGLVLHVFHEPLRDFYDLEGLWADCPTFDIPELLNEAAAEAAPKKKTRKTPAKTESAEAEPKVVRAKAVKATKPVKAVKAVKAAKPVKAEEEAEVPKPKRVRKAPAKP